jgi:hypothetical protein
MTDYYHWLAKELSKKGIVTLSEVQSEIKQLFDKYPYSNN